MITVKNDKDQSVFCTKDYFVIIEYYRLIGGVIYIIITVRKLPYSFKQGIFFLRNIMVLNTMAAHGILST